MLLQWNIHVASQQLLRAIVQLTDAYTIKTMDHSPITPLHNISDHQSTDCLELDTPLWYPVQHQSHLSG